MTLHRNLSVLLVIALAGCGGKDATEVPAIAMDGPPRWRLVREEHPGEGNAATLHVRTPVRTRFRVERTGLGPQVAPWRVLAAGQVVRIAWNDLVEPTEAIEETPTPSDREAGRVEPHAVRFDFHFADRAVRASRLLVFTRKAKGHVGVLHALPPGTYGELPASGRVELGTALVSDLAEGRARLRRRDLETRLVRPEAADPADRVRTMRLYLEIAPLSGSER